MIEFVVEPQAHVPTTKFDALRNKLRLNFPIEHERQDWQVHFALGQGIAPTASAVNQTSSTFLFVTELQDKVVHVSPQRFAYSQLSGYTSWESLRAEASNLWIDYSKIIEPTRVKTAIVRYINRLELALGGAPPSDYLTIFPNVPEGLPAIHNSLLQVTMHDSQTEAIARVTQTISPMAAGNGKFAVDIDIQVSLSVDLAPGDDTLWSRLDPLRELKNRVFFASVTDRSLEQYR